MAWQLLATIFQHQKTGATAAAKAISAETQALLRDANFGPKMSGV